MFKFFWFNKPSPIDNFEKIALVTKELFPEPIIRINKENEKYMIDSSADCNLDSVISDIEEGYIDKTTINTLKNISKKLSNTRKILEHYNELESDISYIIFDDSEEENFESIKIKED